MKFQDFRGITISPVISKVFEHCLLMLFNDYFFSSPNQFGFKKGKGTRDAIFTLSETVNHFVSNGSTVNICALDVSKAFDKISHQALFSKLIIRKAPLCLIEILINWYSKCFCQVKWESSLSRVFILDHGIRQGGILSPYCFSVYVNDALVTLVNSGLGCSFYGLNFGALMYADDIMLIAASVLNLQKLIILAESCFNDINLKLNIGKCVAMRIGKRCNVACSNLEMKTGQVQWQYEVKYLGVLFKQATYLKVNLHPNKVKFFSSFNGI